MRKKIIISLLICTSLMVCCISGCGNDSVSNADTPVVTNQILEGDEVTEYKTMEPPEDGWTIEELMSVTYVCGKQLTYPLTMNSFGNKVEIFEDTLKVQNVKDTPSVMAELCSDNEFMGAAFLIEVV